MTIQHHPKALWWLSLVYSLYAISYGVLFSDLLLYSNLSKTIAFTESHAIQFFASFSTLTFILPILGGYLCDRFGFLRVAKIGLMLSILGFLYLALDSKKTLYIGTALCLTANALIMPSIWAMVGMIYDDGRDKIREAGTTLFYLFFNIGFLISFSASGLVAARWGYSKMFLIFGVGAFLALLVLMFSEKTVQHLPSVKNHLIKLLLCCLCIFFLSVFLLVFLFINNMLVWLITFVIFIYLIFLSRQARHKQQSSNIKAFIYLCLLGVIGITIYNSEFVLLPEFAYHSINLQLNHIELPGQIITTLDPLFCLIFGLLMSFLWFKLAQRGKNPQPATKLSYGIMLPALGYILLALTLHLDTAHKLPLFWIIPAFALFVIGELLVLPIGIAMASRLAPTNKAGVFMGSWNVMQGISALLAGYVAFLTVIKSTQTQLEINQQYSSVFLYLGIIIFIIGVVAFLFRKRINRLLL